MTPASQGQSQVPRLLCVGGPEDGKAERCADRRVSAAWRPSYVDAVPLGGKWGRLEFGFPEAGYSNVLPTQSERESGFQLPTPPSGSQGSLSCLAYHHSKQERQEQRETGRGGWLLLRPLLPRHTGLPGSHCHAERALATRGKGPARPTGGTPGAGASRNPARSLFPV